MFSTGVRATEPLHKRVIRRTTDAFARIGVATLHLQSRHLDEGRVLPQEVTAHVGAFETLRDDPSINRERIGFVGLSATGSIAIAAAADERIRDDVWIVLALGTYFDAASLVAAVTSRHCRTSHGLSAWEPERLSEEVVRETLLSALDADDRVALESGREPIAESGRIVRELLRGTDHERAESLLADLGPRQSDVLRKISARYSIDGLRAPLYLIHDRADRFIPWTEGERLAAAYPPKVYLRLDLLEHAQPRLTAAGPLLRDGWRLHRLMVGILGEAFE